MKCLVTGGAGFIGSHLTDLLLKQDHSVVVLDNFSSSTLELESLNRKNLIVIRGDISDIRFAAIEAADIVYHLASSPRTRTGPTDTPEMLCDSLNGTNKILKAAVAKKTTVVIISSSEVYTKSRRVLLQENSDVFFSMQNVGPWRYAFSKIQGEFLAMSYYEKYKLPVVICRLFNIIGPRQNLSSGAVVPKFVSNALSGKSIQVYSDGSHARHFCDVEDVVRCLVSLSQCDKAMGQIVNVASETGISIKSLAYLIKELAKSDSKVELIDYEKVYQKPFEEVPMRTPQLTKLKSLIGYVPDTPIRDTLKRIIKHERKRKAK